MAALDRSRNKANMILRRRNGQFLNHISSGIFAFGGAGVLFILAQELTKNPPLFIQQMLNGLQLGFIYALIALGYTMVYGIVKLINFAHGDVFMIGAFTSFFAISIMDLHNWPNRLFPSITPALSIILGTVTVMLVSMLVSGTLAVVIERFAYRPLREKPRIAALITAIGVSFFLEYFGALPFALTNNYITFPRPFEIAVFSAGIIPIGVVIALWLLFAISVGAYATLRIMGRRGNVAAQIWVRHPLLQFGMMFGGFLAVVLTLTTLRIETDRGVWDLSVSNAALVIMGGSILLQVVLQYIVSRTRLGKAMRATAYDKPTSRLMGINVDMVITATFAMGGALGGAAGVLYATAFKQVHHLMGVIPGMKAFVAAVLGGIGSIPGALVGSLIMGQAETLAASFISTPMRDAISFSLLIIVLLFRPQGLFGEPPGEKV